MAGKLVEGAVKRDRTEGVGPLQIMEEALHILRGCPVQILAGYYAGTLPFVLGFLFFWADLSRSAFAPQRCVTASMGLALLFVWMKYRHSIFVLGIKASLGTEPPAPLSTRRIFRLAGVQAVIHGTGLFLLPASLLLAFPFGWVYAFYQNALIPKGDVPGLSATWRAAWDQARLRPGQNHLILFIFSLLGTVLLINIGVTLFLIPRLVNSLTGLETVFSLSGIHLLNTTFVAAVLSFSYLLLDPLVKTVYVLRCFYGDSLRTAEDLRVELRKIRHQGKAPTAALVFLCILGAGLFSPGSARGDDPAVSLGITGQGVLVSPEDLERSIEKVLAKPEFTWRMPRTPAEKQDMELKGPLNSLLDRLAGGIKYALKKPAGWIRSFLHWLGELFPEPAPLPKDSRGSGWVPSVRTVLVGMLVLLFFLLFLVVIRTVLQKRHGRGPHAVEPPGPVPDLNDEGLTAEDLPRDRRLSLALELMETGSPREALRAVYLGTLAALAERGVVAIGTHKSNRDYREELERRAHQDKRLRILFAAQVTLFDRVWYGRHRPTPEEFHRFTRRHERIARLVHV